MTMFMQKVKTRIGMLASNDARAKESGILAG
jgi:hypothetical protein